MLKLKSILIVTAMLLLSPTSYANSWRTAYVVPGTQQCSYPYCQCVYEELLSKFRFTVTMDSVYCPVTIKINAETGQWRKN